MVPGSDDATAARKTALTAAIARHRQGQFAEAEAVYRQVLADDPSDPDALHYLGVLCHHRGRNGDAVDRIRRAIARAPDYADAHNNLGNVLRALGRAEEAAAAEHRPYKAPNDGTPVLSTPALPAVFPPAQPFSLPPGTARTTRLARDFLSGRRACRGQTSAP